MIKIAAEKHTTINACEGMHPPFWHGNTWVCAQCGEPLDARKRAITEPEVVWIDTKWLRPR